MKVFCDKIVELVILPFFYFFMQKLIKFICIVYIHVHIIIFFFKITLLFKFSNVILIKHNYHEKTGFLPMRKQRHRSAVQ